MIRRLHDKNDLKKFLINLENLGPGQEVNNLKKLSQKFFFGKRQKRKTGSAHSAKALNMRNNKLECFVTNLV